MTIERIAELKFTRLFELIKKPDNIDSWKWFLSFKKAEKEWITKQKLI